jgi:hypothetical protein
MSDFENNAEQESRAANVSPPSALELPETPRLN